MSCEWSAMGIVDLIFKDAISKTANTIVCVEYYYNLYLCKTHPNQVTQEATGTEPKHNYCHVEK